MALSLRKKPAAVATRLDRSRETLNRELDDLLHSLSEKVADVRDALSSAAETGAEKVGDGVDAMVKSSRKGVKALDRRWRKMDRGQKVAVAGGLLAALAAAAAAPTVIRKIRQR
jgi:hypothetical protein